MVRSSVSKQSHPALVDLEIDRYASGPVFRQIIRQLRERIDNAVLPCGTRLPPTRDLAQQLGIARNCVVEAYDELIADGVLEGRGRSGTFVAASRGFTAPRREEVIGQSSVLRRIDNENNDAPPQPVAAFDWRLGQVNVRALPLEAWRNACREAGRHLPPAGYGDPRGEPGLRHTIAYWLHEHRSVSVDPNQIVVTHGTGQALHLVSRTFLRDGDMCAVEDPGYLGANWAFARSGATLHHVPVDDEGMLVERIIESPTTPALVHVTPAHQYPLGGRLSGPRRRSLIDLARTHGTMIVENEYDCEFHYAGTRYPPLFASAPENTLLLSTFAKAVSPSLRLGFIAAPKAAATALAAHIERERVHVSWPVQKIIETLLVSGELDKHLRRVRRHYGAMRDLVRGRLAEYVSEIELRGDEGGLHVVVAGRERAFDLELRKALNLRGIVFNEVREFASSAMEESNGFLLGYAHMDLSDLSAALDELTTCIQQCYSR
ncbi:PLP-dependent aminotransferase family protein [Caballeronia sp. LZ032]|uniref:MocR-like pyridoxine biosynthesis transcription factor PdxR n=1 Tax=Caballeronia sp. LZ032 TaxID=3038565 RepID=UPI002859FACD|nr:PLP-dependent aminotransferase family protein [Caballeronia sp. LZ032]MDR5877751.1 PLP-dependent aminotransferase family protein [Caballeronia sp. LZ032]